MDMKNSYNSDQIKEAVASIIQTRETIKAELSQAKYEPLLKSLEQTIESLNNTDDIIIYNKQIKEEIISPVGNIISSTSKQNKIFGYVGIGLTVIALVISPLYSTVLEQPVRNFLGIQGIVEKEYFSLKKENIELKESNQICKQNSNKLQGQVANYKNENKFYMDKIAHLKEDMAKKEKIASRAPVNNPFADLDVIKSYQPAYIPSTLPGTSLDSTIGSSNALNDWISEHSPPPGWMYTLPNGKETESEHKP